MESSPRVIKLIFIDVVAMDRLELEVAACRAFVGSSEFFKTRRKGNQMLVVQRCHNSYGWLLMLLEFGNDKRHSLIVVLEGSKGEWWRGFVEVLR